MEPISKPDISMSQPGSKEAIRKSGTQADEDQRACGVEWENCVHGSGGRRREPARGTWIIFFSAIRKPQKVSRRWVMRSDSNKVTLAAEW